MDVPAVVGMEAGLSFLGLGVSAPTPSWGSILNDGYSYLRNSPWPLIAGGIPLILVTLGFTFFGESLRDILDPKLRGKAGNPDMIAPILDIRDLSVSYHTNRGLLRALRNIDMQIQPGRIIGIVGESGCGKSTLISAIIRLLAPNAQIDGGSILFKGNDLLSLDPEAMRALRGDEISMVFQDPMTSLNPVLTIGRQMTDVQHRNNLSKRQKNCPALPGCWSGWELRMRRNNSIVIRITFRVACASAWRSPWP